jgi:hypothetical protein
LAADPKFYRDGAGQLHSWRLSDALLAFIERHVSQGSKTLEIGAGVSTVLFAIKRTRHIAIVPNEDEASRIAAFCDAHRIARDTLTFEIDVSERCLPRLEVSGLDLVLIDGSHAFPMPFIDWYYTADRLRLGGLLLVDDTHLWTGHTLKTFLAAEPGWKLEADFPPRSVVFRKREGRTWGKNESEQPYVMQQTLDLVFDLHREYVEWFRPFLPADGFHARESTLRFRAFRARERVRHALARLVQAGMLRRLRR